MFQTKVITTGCIGALALAVALFSPTREVTSADALVGFASGDTVTVENQQSNKGLLALLLAATLGSAVWALTDNDDGDAEIAPATPTGKDKVAVASSSVAPAANTPEASETFYELKKYITEQPKNLLVVATGGAGKGITLANLCRWRYEKNKQFRAVWVDPKNDPDESGYMAHPCIQSYRFSASEMTASEVADKVKTLVSRFRELCANLPPKTPVWLIMDEWYYVLSVLQQHDKDVLNSILDMLRSTVSLLDAQHKHIVLVGQSPNLGDLLPGNGGLAANLNTLCLFKRDSTALKILQKAAQTGVVPHAIAKAEELYAAADQSPRNRAMFFDGELWPSPELENFGNYDRDSGEHLGKSQPALTPFGVCDSLSEKETYSDLPTDLPTDLQRLETTYRNSPVSPVSNPVSNSVSPVSPCYEGDTDYDLMFYLLGKGFKPFCKNSPNTPLVELVEVIQKGDVPDTKIIEDVMGCKGRHFKEGRYLLGIIRTAIKDYYDNNTED